MPSQDVSPARIVIIATALALALALTFALTNRLAEVSLLTVDVDPEGTVGCLTSGVGGQLVVDPGYGTAIVEITRGLGQNYVHSYPVRWPFGYIGRRSGGELEVLDRSGNVVARTGTNVSMMGGYQGQDPTTWLACGWVQTH